MAGAMAAIAGLAPSATVLAASAVELVAWSVTPGSSRPRKPRHCALAWGMETTSVIWLSLFSFAIGIVGGLLLSQLYRRRSSGKQRG